MRSPRLLTAGDGADASRRARSIHKAGQGFSA